MMQQPKVMSKGITSETAYITALVAKAGGEKVGEYRERHPVTGSFLEFSFALKAPKQFEAWMRKQKVKSLFHRKKEDPEEKIRLRTAVYTGPMKGLYVHLLDELNRLEKALGGE